MTYTRSAHYWAWFVLFGITLTLASLVQRIPLDSEAFWLLGVGIFGILCSTKKLGNWCKPFDVLVGVIFVGVGLVGILHNFSIDLVNRGTTPLGQTVKPVSFLGLSLDLLPSLIHTMLGYFSLNMGFKTTSGVSQLLVSSSADK